MVSQASGKQHAIAQPGSQSIVDHHIVKSQGRGWRMQSDTSIAETCSNNKHTEINGIAQSRYSSRYIRQTCGGY